MSKFSKKNSPDGEKAKKPLSIFGVEFVYLYLFGIGVAFIGWIAENAFKFAVSGVIDSRFHLLPFISPYLLIPFAFHIALGTPNDVTFFGKKVFKISTAKTKILSNIIAYFAICACVFFGELAVGSLWEILFDVRLWNYSKHPLHITKFTSVISVFGFGTGAYLIFKLLYTPILNLIRKKISFKTAKWICLTLGVLIVLDTVRMMISTVILGEAPNFWRFDFW